ncbi:unnamed protein product [Rotaria sordida]|uniref:Uncharacterized protein n=1 Tax=Rotaria sordida TaxID=392033 RepID=A0A819P5Q3_9BILA|nr:unnamed protein product [Rotaria sordida]CAF3997836.1 unnamed protein product [Rotaria sordida]CAF4003081.1 unnamed protein product [Rotaria sordida]
MDWILLVKRGGVSELQIWSLRVELTSLDLKKITKLVVEPYNFYFEELLHLLCFTSNLYILKFDSICFCKNTVTSIQQKEEFHHISDVNKLKRLHIRETCTFEEIKQIIPFLLSKTNVKTCQLFFVCIKGIPKICVQELDKLIKFQNLLKDYFIQFINSDIYLWW